jgi:FKBP-type peptidyl-prolyl cis-trans isomerase FklB
MMYYMKFFISMTLLVLATTGFAQNAPAIKTAQDSASYAYGIALAQNMKRQMTTELNYEVFSYALGQALGNKPGMMYTQEQAAAVYGEYNRVQSMKAGEVARVAGEQFLAENKKRKTVTTTASGLQYEVMTKGPGGAKPAATNTVKVHYHGTLTDGTMFDSSVERGQPATFGLNQVISGWTEGVQLMSAGDKFKFFLPYNLAYGERAAGATIKPYSALVFEVELLEIVK